MLLSYPVDRPKKAVGAKLFSGNANTSKLLAEGILERRVCLPESPIRLFEQYFCVSLYSLYLQNYDLTDPYYEIIETALFALFGDDMSD